MSDPAFGIVMAAVELKLAAPREYDGLVEAMKTFEQRCMADFLAAEAGGIFLAQGKAQVVTQLRQKLENCLKLKAGYERK
jgi:hypothetical protein